MIPEALCVMAHYFPTDYHPPPSGKKYSIMVDLEGAKGKDGAKWSSRCGALIRCNIPIGYEEWRNVDDFYKENLWKELLNEFEMDMDPKLARPILEKRFPQYFRTVKSKLRNKYLRPNGQTIPKSATINTYPDGIDKTWWEKFVDNEYSDKKKKQCMQNAQNKAKNSITHTLGRKPYRSVYEEMAMANPKEKVTRTMVWKVAHKSKKNGEVLPCAAKTYALIEEAEEKQKLEASLNGDGSTSLHDVENDPIAEVFGSDKKKNYCRAVSSSFTVKQIKTIQASKAIAEKNEKHNFHLWSLELQNQVAKQVANQVDDALKSFTSSFLNKVYGMQQNQHISNVTPNTDGASNLEGSPINNVAPPCDNGSSSREKQFVTLLSQDLKKDVAKGYLGSQTTCHFRNVVPNVEKVVWVSEVIEPEAPIYDGPQGGNYKLCEIVDGGFVIWPMFRIRNM